jgi:hypothetical protein
MLAVAALLGVTIVAAQSCQQSQVRFSKEDAMTAARSQADFTPERTQVRLVRQGLTGHPFGYAELTTVRVDANTGKIAAVNPGG